MPDSLTIFGTTYSNVKGFKAAVSSSSTLTYIRPQGLLEVTENSANIDVTEYATVSVNVEGAGGSGGMTVIESEDINGGTVVDITGGVVTLSLQMKTITPTTSSQSIIADSSYNGLSTVVVNSIPNQYIIPSGTKIITANSSNIDVANYATASVSVSSSGGGNSNLTFYTNNQFSAVYTDTNLTTTVADAYNYDYDAIFAAIQAAPVQVIYLDSNGGKVMNVVSVKYDRVDETLDLYVLNPSANWSTSLWIAINAW